MTRRTAVLLAALGAAGLLVVLGQPFFIITEGTQVVITRFGDPVTGPVADPGLHVKVPFIDVVNPFENRLLEWDGDPNQIPTKDKRFIWIDATARWKIVDPLKFLQSVGDERGAYARLDDIIDAETRNVISEQPLIEAVRSTNRDLTREIVQDGAEDSELTLIEDVTLGRGEITRQILARAQQMMPSYGIELVDMRIKRIQYIDEVREKIYERMIAERKRAAEQLRSEGQGRKAEIEGRTELDLKQITSSAYFEAQKVKGRADAEATQIYAEAYSKDPSFYDFVKSLETYEGSVDSQSTLILSTDSDYFKYLKKANPAP